MGKIIFNDRKRVNNRLYVQKHRYNKKLKQIHSEQVNEKIKKHLNGFKQNRTDARNDFSDMHDEFSDMHDEDSQVEFRDKLRIWVLNHRITRKALNDLLLILISAGFGVLPKDSRTLMSTPTHIPINILSNGKMWFLGVKKCLESVLGDTKKNIKITLDFNFDGFPISKSSHKQFWPILSAIRGIFCFISSN